MTTIEEAINAAIRTGMREALAELDLVVPDQGLYRYKDAAKWLSVSVTKLREWTDAGELSTVKRDGCVRIPSESLMAFKATWRLR